MATSRLALLQALRESKTSAPPAVPRTTIPEWGFEPCWDGTYRRDAPIPGARIAAGWTVHHAGKPDTICPFAAVVSIVRPDGSFYAFSREGLLPYAAGHPWQWADLVYGANDACAAALAFAMGLHAATGASARTAFLAALDPADDADILVATRRAAARPRAPSGDCPCRRKMVILRENCRLHAREADAARMARWLLDNVR